MRRLVIAILVVASQSAMAQGSTAQANKTYEAVVEGMSCRQQTSGRLDCAYSIAGALQFVIAGVGQEDAVVSFTKVDSTSGFVAGFAALHGCVIVRPVAAGDTATALAFVSPRDGRVYRAWQLCKQGPKR